MIFKIKLDSGSDWCLIYFYHLICEIKSSLKNYFSKHLLCAGNCTFNGQLNGD